MVDVPRALVRYHGRPLAAERQARGTRLARGWHTARHSRDRLTGTTVSAKGDATPSWFR